MAYVAVKRPEGYEDNTWWHGDTISYAFDHPKVRMRLERLMGTNMVLFTDRRYMEDLRQSIYNEEIREQRNRINRRKEREEDRVMKLIMTAVTDMADAPREFQLHPVYQTVMNTRALLEIKHQRIMENRYKWIRHYSYKCRTWDMSELAEPRAIEPFAEMVEKGSWSDEGIVTKVRRPSTLTDPLCILLPEDITEDKYTISAEDLAFYYYVAPEIKKLHQQELTVEELYARADELIGSLHTLKDNPLIKPPKKF